MSIGERYRAIRISQADWVRNCIQRPNLRSNPRPCISMSPWTSSRNGWPPLASALRCFSNYLGCFSDHLIWSLISVSKNRGCKTHALGVNTFLKTCIKLKQYHGNECACTPMSSFYWCLASISIVCVERHMARMEVLWNSFECSCCGQCYGASVRYDDHYILITKDHVSMVVTCTCVRTCIYVRTVLTCVRTSQS